MTEALSHPSGLDERVVAKVVARRGRVHAFETLTATRTSLVVIDLDVASVEADDNCRSMIPRINRMAHALRSLGGCVAWILSDFEANEISRAIYGAQLARQFETRSAGDGATLWHELDAEPQDLRAVKIGASAFFPGKCDLAGRLTGRGIDTLLMAGTVTNVCVESSARDAVELGFKVTLISDACVGHAHGQHESTLLTFYRNFGDVRPTSDVIDLLNRTGHIE